MWCERDEESRHATRVMGSARRGGEARHLSKCADDFADELTADEVGMFCIARYVLQITRESCTILKYSCGNSSQCGIVKVEISISEGQYSPPKFKRVDLNFCIYLRHVFSELWPSTSCCHQPLAVIGRDSMMPVAVP